MDPTPRRKKVRYCLILRVIGEILSLDISRGGGQQDRRCAMSKAGTPTVAAPG